MENNITVEEFIEQKFSSIPTKLENIKELMIEFAKLHCEAQVNAILENVNLIGNNAHSNSKPSVHQDSVYVIDQNGPDYIYTVNKDSIINAYLLDKIK